MKTHVLFVLAVFLSHVVQGISGFAGTVLAVPAGTFLVGLHTSIAVMNMVGLFASVYICLVARRHMRWPVIRTIFTYMFPSLLAGFALVGYLRDYDRAQLIVLGAFVAVAGVVGLYRGNSPAGERGNKALLVIGGLFHGMYVCGGTLVVMYLKGRLEKEEFRANISFIWLLFNSLNFLFHYSNGYWTPLAISLTLAATPALFLSVYLGGVILRRISPASFAVFTNILIILSGLTLLLNALFRM